MRRRSFSGPLLLLLIGGLFLWRNLHPETPVFEILSQYWPFLLIAWGLLRLIEVLVSRDTEPRGSFSGGEIVLVILICFAGLGLWQAHQYGIHFNTGGLQWFGEQYEYPVTATAPAAGMKRLVFENPRGNIKVTGADVEEVTVTGHKIVRAYSRTDADRTNDSTPVEIVPQGDRLLIRTNQDKVPDNQRLSDDLEVTVPKAMAIESRGTTGDYEVNDIAGDLELGGNRGDVRIARIGGNARLDIGRSDLIRATDVKGKIELNGSGADVELENIAGQVTISGSYRGTLDFKNLAKPLQFEGARNTELNVQAIPGQISMDLGSLNGKGIVGPLKLSAGFRDVRLEQFTGSMDVESQRGDIELHPSSPVAAIDARSGNGRIELALPEKAPFTLEATAERGEAVNDYGDPIQHESQGRTATLRGNVGNGPTVRLTAHRGSVEVRKEGTEASDENGLPAPPKPPKTPKLPSAKELKDREVRM